MNQNYIKNFILESEIISEEDFKIAQDYAFEKNIDILEALANLDFLDQEILAKIYANIMGVNKIDLSQKIISSEDFKKIPEAISSEHNLICFESGKNFTGDFLNIAFCDIKSIEILEDFFSPEIKLNFFLADFEEILEKKKKYQEIVSEEVFFKNQNNLQKILKLEDWGIKNQKDIPEVFQKDVANQVYSEKFILSLLEYAVSNKADFIFFNISDEDILISFRIFERNYDILKVERERFFSILQTLKTFCDVNIFEDFLVKKSSFIEKIKGKEQAFFTTFIKTDFGTTATIEINKEKKFRTDIAEISPHQKEFYLQSKKKDSGLLVLSGKNQKNHKKTLYNFLESDIEKNKEIFLLEKNIFHPLSYTKQISIESAKNILNFLPKIIENIPDVIFLEKISDAILPIIFNYVSTSKKVFISNEQSPERFVEKILEKDFDKGQMVKNFSAFLEHQDFENIEKEQKKEIFLNKQEQKILENFLDEKDLQEIFKEFLGENFKAKKISKIPFHTKSKKSKKFFAEKTEEKISIFGISNFGIFLENCFLKRYPLEKTKVAFKKQAKKSVLENALLASFLGQVDIQEVLKYLTK